MKIRQFVPEDAVSVSQLIIHNLQLVNIRDYSIEAIDALMPFFTPDRIIDESKYQYMIVCVIKNDLVGTASLDNDRVRNVFVDVDQHMKGIGRVLMSDIETFARRKNKKSIYLHSSLLAEGFYRKLGYKHIERIDRDLDGIPIPDIKIEKDLSVFEN